MSTPDIINELVEDCNLGPKALKELHGRADTILELVKELQVLNECLETVETPGCKDYGQRVDYPRFSIRASKDGNIMIDFYTPTGTAEVDLELEREKHSAFRENLRKWVYEQVSNKIHETEDELKEV
tara:strand:+ start:11043 stop:11423 length:381 start_codon:yes stop_codon:yes gene_type:complete